MKYVLILIVAFMAASCKSTVNKNNRNKSVEQSDSLAILFKKIDYSTYVDKTITELLKVSPLDRLPIRTECFTEPPHQLSYIQYVYSGKIAIHIYPETENLKYVNSYSATDRWDMNLLKKEKIWLIHVFIGSDEMMK